MGEYTGGKKKVLSPQALDISQRRMPIPPGIFKPGIHSYSVCCIKISICPKSTVYLRGEHLSRVFLPTSWNLYMIE
jgi:hypothetical protein